ncbi:MAG TPA: hypothetical protein VKA15_03365, partial [Isosphaeraceae bacterium]|nr:hypothetical protein [Isosphaeraceae bacterium]
RETGMWQCLGTLRLIEPFICDVGGTLQRKGSSVSTSNLKLILEGVDPSNGRILWSHRLANVASFLQGGGVPVADEAHAVVPLLNGTLSLLDFRTGTLATPPKSDVFWCQRAQNFQIVSITGVTGTNHRSGTPVEFPCSATGVQVSGTPSYTWSGVGVVIDGLFIWPSPHGLVAYQIKS